jgi:Tfp pilus assembly protein PilF
VFTCRVQSKSALTCAPRSPVVQALQLQQRGDLEGSRILVEDVLRSEPAHVLARCCAAFSAALTGDLDGAEKQFTDASTQ